MVPNQALVRSVTTFSERAQQPARQVDLEDQLGASAGRIYCLSFQRYSQAAPLMSPSTGTTTLMQRLLVNVEGSRRSRD